MYSTGGPSGMYLRLQHVKAAHCSLNCSSFMLKLGSCLCIDMYIRILVLVHLLPSKANLSLDVVSWFPLIYLNLQMLGSLCVMAYRAVL